MNFKPHKAFSLTELIIVLVIIAVLFAAMAPIITKRHIADTAGVENIWNFVNNDTERDAYFDPGSEEWTSSIYVGMNPVNNNPNSGKLVVNSGDIQYEGESYAQPQFQFRFSPNDNELSNGIDSGSLLVDNSGNISLGQIQPSIGSNNTVLGFSALKSAEAASDMVAIGTGALEDITDITGPITAVGTNAGSQDSAQEYIQTEGYSGIYIGAGAGMGSSGSNIGIGYHSSYNTATNNKESFANVAIGTHTGMINVGDADSSSQYNVFINNRSTSGAGMEYINVIGFGSYTEDVEYQYAAETWAYMTAIGYRACSSMIPWESSVTCLGYGSGSEQNGSSSYFGDLTPQNNEHILLGGIPQGGFSGRAVMEVHTYGGDINTSNVSSADSADLVLNSNLVIRGKLYSNDGGTPANYKFVDTRSEELSSPIESIYYSCQSDDMRSVLLTYNIYVCNDDYSDSEAPPRTLNILLKDGNVPAGVINSDERLKANIVENNIGLEKLLLLEAYNYTFKDDKSLTPQVGVIAQDLQKIFPTSVSKNEKGFLSIRWDEMFYAMINSIKELSQKVEQLTQRIVNITNDINVVKSGQKDIRKKLSSLDERLKKLERK